MSIENYIRPNVLTPIAAKVFESVIMKWVDAATEGEIDKKLFIGISRTSTTDVLVEMVHLWYEGTDNLDSSDLINHHLLLEQLQLYDLPSLL